MLGARIYHRAAAYEANTLPKELLCPVTFKACISTVFHKRTKNTNSRVLGLEDEIAIADLLYKAAMYSSPT